MTTCDSCKAFHAKGPSAGDCRRHAPVVQEGSDVAVWPFVSRQHWCLDYVRRKGSGAITCIADEDLSVGQLVAQTENRVRRAVPQDVFRYLVVHDIAKGAQASVDLETGYVMRMPDLRG